MTNGFGIDPTQDIAGRIGCECFLCGLTIHGEPLWFGPVGALATKLPHHGHCLEGKSPLQVVTEYNRRLHDLANVARTA